MKKVSWDSYREAVGESEAISLEGLKGEIGDTLKAMNFKDSYFDSAYYRSRNGREYVIRLRSGSGPVSAKEGNREITFYGANQIAIKDPTG